VLFVRRLVRLLVRLLVGQLVRQLVGRLAFGGAVLITLLHELLIAGEVALIGLLHELLAVELLTRLISELSIEQLIIDEVVLALSLSYLRLLYLVVLSCRRVLSGGLHARGLLILLLTYQVKPTCQLTPLTKPISQLLIKQPAQL
jgi:hypothetical protein